MKICALSDLHGTLISIKACELVLICGDTVPLNKQRYIEGTYMWYKNIFKEWANNLDCDKVLFIAGNHELSFQNNSNDYRKLFPSSEKVTYLENTSYKYLSREGKEYSIYGTPACKVFGSWAFMYSDDKLQDIYSTIPSDCDILISHDAPDLNDCGLIPSKHGRSQVNAGNIVLADAIMEKSPRYALCGHIHEGNHKLRKIGSTKLANVSILDDTYNIAYEPLYLNITK